MKGKLEQQLILDGMSATGFGLKIGRILLALVVLTSVSSALGQLIDNNNSSKGYLLNNSSIDYRLSDGIGPFKIGHVNDKANYSLSLNGLKITPKETNGWIYVKPMNLTTASTIAVRLSGLEHLDANHKGFMEVQLERCKHEGRFYQLRLYFGGQRISLTPGYYLGKNSTDMERINFNYNLDELNILIQVVDGIICCGINGIEYQMPVNYTGGYWNDLCVKNITFGSSSPWTSTLSFNVERIAISQSSHYSYIDKLHKTITPGGYDFTYGIQYHADNANPEQLSLLAELTKEYGIKGEFDAWMNVENPNFEYSVKTNQSYKDRLLMLQSLGWDIGLHAVTNYSAKRSELLPLIDEFNKTFGKLRSWTDHGLVSQDINQFGNDRSSEYYIADYLSSNDIMIWVNNESHSHSKGMDLNKDIVFYHYSGFPGLNLEKVSKYSVLTFFDDWDASYAPTTTRDMDNRLRAFAAEGAVILLHDYTIRYFYIEQKGTKYALWNFSNMGYPYTTPKSEEESKSAAWHRGGTWHIFEPVLVLYDALAKYTVWHATPRQIWDRARAIQNITLHESATAVEFINPTPYVINNFQLTTISEPKYALLLNGKYFNPIKGAQNWHFVIDEIPKGSVTAQKVAVNR